MVQSGSSSTWSLVELDSGNVGFWGEGKTGVPGEKPLGAKERINNKLNPHMASTRGFEPGPHWWEVSALTTAPSLARVCTLRNTYRTVPVDLHWLSKRQSLSATTVIFRTTFTWTIIFNLLKKFFCLTDWASSRRLQVWYHWGFLHGRLLQE